ncbi:MAG: serine/threonine protein kinase [Akkermansia sp.]|nr:serine/threonine protein kinase [Akkermansia sp.]
MPAALSAPVDALPPGAVVAERYKLLKALGQGGFGITYIAWDAELARNVAVKECFPAALCRRDPMSGSVVPLSAAAESAYLAALDDMHKEAKTLAQVEHARVLRVHDVIWGNGSVFLIMPWLGGGSLADRMADTAHLPTEEQQLAWLADLVEGLAYLHGKGITHRDIKPSNILFDDDGRPVIIDLGAALNRNPADLTRSTTTRGAFSPGYASPEQATGKGKIGPWTDFYSLAATWYELLTGTRPEDAEKRLMEDDLLPLPAATLRIPCPREVVALLQRNLSLRPAERCAAAADWQTVLRGGALPPLPRRRAGLVMGALAVATLTALALAGYAALRPAAAPASAPATPPAAPPAAAPTAAGIPAARAELRRKVAEHFRVAEFVAVCRDLQQRAEAAEEALKKDVAQQIAPFRKRIAAAQDEATLDAIDKELNAFQAKVSDTTDNKVFYKEFYALLDGYEQENYASLYPTDDPAELLLLPAVAQEVEQQFHEAMNDVLNTLVSPSLHMIGDAEVTELRSASSKRRVEIWDAQQ